MRNCDYYQVQLLDHLYGLLEPDESLALIEHAGQCDNCREALLKADGQRKLLAAAAKSEFPGLRFETPAAETVGPSRKASKRRLGWPQLSWQRWAVAAALLLAFAGIGGTYGRYVYNIYTVQKSYDQALARLDNLAYQERQLVRKQDEIVARAVEMFRSADARRTRIEELQNQELEDAANAVFNANLLMVVTGPDTIRLGEKSEYRIDTRDLKNQPAPVKLDAVVRDQTTNRVVFEQKGVRSTGSYVLALAPEVSIQGGSNLALEIVASSEAGARGELKERLTLARASYITHLYTDKPIYQPGETVQWRSLTLDRSGLKPPTEDLRILYTLKGPQGNQLQQWAHTPRVVDAQGKDILGPDQKPIRGIGTGEWLVPAHFPGGEYVLEITEVQNRFAPERRKFLVNQYQKPRLIKELRWDKASYGPGSEVVANVKVEKVEDRLPLVGQPVRAVLRVDGVAYNVHGQRMANDQAAAMVKKTDGRGAATIAFKLPAVIEKGDASLSVQFTDGATNEALVRPIPVVVNQLQLEFFPEGGELVALVPNRVYFQARTMLDKPAEIRAALLDETGAVVVDNIRTLNDPKEPGINQGMGWFGFTPKVGKKYQLRIEEPAGVPARYPLPAIGDEGVVLSVAGGVSADPLPITAEVYSVGKDRELLVGIYCRGRLLSYQEVTAKQGAATEIKLKPAKDIGGMYRVTVFEKLAQDGSRQQLKPVAERLVYRIPTERLNIAIRTDKSQYAPGEQVKLSVKANTETGEPAPTILLVGVVDKSVIKMADERTARTMPTHFLLTSEVRRAEDLEYADVLLSDHAQAKDALDLLLGTQGWRRFLESDPRRFQNKTGKSAQEMRCQADVDRLLVAMSNVVLDPAKAINNFELRQNAIIARYEPKFDEVSVQLVGAAEAWEAAREGPALAEKRQLHQEAVQARQASNSALAQLHGYDNFNAELRSRLLFAFGLILLAAGVGSLVIGVTRNLRRAASFYTTAVGAVAVCGLLLLGTFVIDSQLPEEEQFAAASKTAAAGADPGQLRDAPREQAEADRDGRERFDLRRNAAPDRAGEGGGRGQAGAAKLNGRFGREPMAPALGLPAAKPAAEPKPDAKNAGPGNQPQAAVAVREKAAAGKEEAKGARAPAGGLANGLQKAKEFQQKLLPAQPGQERKAAGPAAPPPALAADRPAEAKKQLEEQRANRAAARDGVLAMRARNPLQQEALDRALKDLKADEKEALDKNRGRQQDAYRGLPLPAPCVVREYAHQRFVGPDPDVRADFSETVYWHPVLVLPDGKGEVRFQLCDSVTSFQAVAFGHTVDGRLGAVDTSFDVKKPFNLEAKLPLELTSNDVVDMPVAVENASTDSKDIFMHLDLNGFEVVPASSRAQVVKLAPNTRSRVVFRLKPTIREGVALVTLRGSAEPFGSDTVRYTVKIVPEGFPTVDQVSDLLERVAQHEVELPNQVLKGTLKARLQVYPSPLADLQKGLEGLLREPHGCFEQTSTTNYPNALILSYLKESNQSNPRLEADARGKLTRGYGRLVSFECSSQGSRQGYEWFGGTAPAHEALTAYGLLQFRDLQRIGFPVDDEMVKRTRQWLLGRRDGKGGFLRNPRALDTFGRAPNHITNAYIVWALTETESGTNAREDLDKEINALVEQSKDSQDPYFLALVANGLLNRNRTDEAGLVIKKLGTLQKMPEGHLPGAQTSITGSGGRALEIETTALAVLAWTKANRPQDFHPQLQAAVKWIGQQRGGHGGFGSTQSTILALKALLAFARARTTPSEAGELTLTINGQEIARKSFPAGLKDTLTLEVPEADNHLKAGKNELLIAISGKTVLPYTFSWNYQSLKPVSALGTPIRLAARLERATVKDGETVNLKVSVANTAKKGHGMVVAIVGLPAGLGLPENLEQLKEYARLRNDGTEPGLISAFEVRDRELVLYWRQLAPEQKIDVNLELLCRVPGEYRGPASRSYLYYNADHKHWIDPIQVSVAPKD